MPPWLGILLNPMFLIAAVVIIGGSLVALRMSKKQMQHKLSTFAPQRVQLTSDQPTVTFADVAGLDEVVAELKEVKDYLTNAERFKALGAQLPRGMLLYGPPGSGKTLLARALAGETGVPFYSVSASDRKSTRLNSSHSQISYAVFCLKKKKESIYAVYNT